ncbi:MAG: polysaccharide biosynthesis/export family protein [Terriglobales bacterium]|jgi:polysaccharide export outer membrane protein
MPVWNCRFLPRTSRILIALLCSTSFSVYSTAQTPINGIAAPATDTAKQDAATLAAQSSASRTPLPNPNVRLGAGDLIDINVFGVPDLSTKTRISGSGDIYLPLIDYVHIADLTADEAQAVIQKRLEAGGFVRNPHVSIFVEESSSLAVTLVGEVNHPGPYTVARDRRLFDMISAAGGLTDKAGRIVTIEHRDDPEHKITLQLSANLAEDTNSNIDILPGDTIVVSRAGIVYVVGDVQHPSGFLIEDNSLSVLKALALAGGSNRTASLNHTKILRQTPNGTEEIPIPLKKILYAKSPDIPLVKGDVLFIPGSSAKAAAYRTGDAAISMTTALAVVAAHP